MPVVIHGEATFGAGGAAFSGAEYYLTAGTTITTGVGNVIPIDPSTIVYDTDSYYSAGLFMAPFTGRYRVTFNATVDLGVVASLGVQSEINAAGNVGLYLLDSNSGGPPTSSINIHQIVQLAGAPGVGFDILAWSAEGAISQTFVHPLTAGDTVGVYGSTGSGYPAGIFEVGSIEIQFLG